MLYSSRQITCFKACIGFTPHRIFTIRAKRLNLLYFEKIFFFFSLSNSSKNYLLF
ncbi:hypothetical protein AAJ76_400020247 [Vairimorpha ceranae]|uniref:Uncharacterized protein n=1 Tax=Vairimorpha ceranae TaxID=40302 RepID=A0A0F9WU16_9MICR|nr:hypothetical protein AAJ76_400020247 [Vairimorpha ceranae]KKO76308.1 hypothetical protein AAJ76_400020247 [Vairimorpha ceranae]